MVRQWLKYQKKLKAIIDNGPGFGLLKGKIVRDVLVAGNAYIF